MCIGEHKNWKWGSQLNMNIVLTLQAPLKSIGIELCSQTLRLTSRCFHANGFRKPNVFDDQNE